MRKDRNIKESKRPLILAIVIFLIFITLTGISWLSKNNDNSDNSRTLYQGTQARYNEISIGLVNVQGDSAWLSVHKDGDTDEPFKKEVSAGDKFDVYGYEIEVRSVKDAFDLFSIIGATGTSKDYIKFEITKK